MAVPTPNSPTTTTPDAPRLIWDVAGASPYQIARNMIEEAVAAGATLEDLPKIVERALNTPVPALVGDGPFLRRDGQMLMSVGREEAEEIEDRERIRIMHRAAFDYANECGALSEGSTETAIESAIYISMDRAYKRHYKKYRDMRNKRTID